MALAHDSYELTKLKLDLADFQHECESLLRTFSHTGCTFAKQDTTVTGDKTDNNTTILSDYGECHMTWAMDPKSTKIAEYANKQIQGQNSGDKATGSVHLYDSEGNETSSWNIERWYLAEYGIGPFSSKSSSNLVQRASIKPEKFVRA